MSAQAFAKSHQPAGRASGLAETSALTAPPKSVRPLAGPGKPRALRLPTTHQATAPVSPGRQKSEQHGPPAPARASSLPCPPDSLTGSLLAKGLARVRWHDWCPSRTPFAGCAGDGWRVRGGAGGGGGAFRGGGDFGWRLRCWGLPWAGRTAEPTIEQRDLKLSRLAWEFQEPDQTPAFNVSQPP
jgi:hypothetical protein